MDGDSSVAEEVPSALTPQHVSPRDPPLSGLCMRRVFEHNVLGSITNYPSFPGTEGSLRTQDLEC